MTPIPDEQAGPREVSVDPLDKLAAEIIEISNMALRGEIDLDTWEAAIEEATRSVKK